MEDWCEVRVTGTTTLKFFVRRELCSPGYLAILASVVGFPYSDYDFHGKNFLACAHSFYSLRTIHSNTIANALIDAIAYFSRN